MQVPEVLGRSIRLLLIAVLPALLSCGDDGGGSARVDASDCGGCHTGQVAAWENFSSHKGVYQTCTFCHEEADPEPGPGHRTSAWCDECHSEAAHLPERLGVAARDGSLQLITCTTCHDPMGSRNIYLVRETILVEPGRGVPVDFRNIEGRADFGFAELGTEDGGLNGIEPGAGLCEVCHAETAAYNRDGTGVGHFTSRCTGCHDHAIAFGVEPSCAVCHGGRAE
ncbi:MAG: multiheme c-type cytochrome [bacterium]